MDSNTYIANSQMVISFGRDYNIRRKVFEFEDSLKEYFKVPFKTTAISDESDPNLPRFETLSRNEHSKLQVSQTRITLITQYDEKFRLNVSDVRKYLSEKFEILKPLANEQKLEFIAYIIELGAVFDKDKLNSYIREKSGAKAASEECREFQLLYSVRYKNDYFLNIRNSKFAREKFRLDEQKKTLIPTGQIQHGISVIVDINSKPYFKEKNTFDDSLFYSIENEIFQIVENLSIEDYLEGNIKNN